MSAVLCLALAACCGNAAEGEQNGNDTTACCKKECCDKPECCCSKAPKCCKMMQEKFANWDNMTVAEKKALIDEQEAAMKDKCKKPELSEEEKAKMEAKKAECKAKMEEMMAKWENFDNLSDEEKEEVLNFKKDMMLRGPRHHGPKGCMRPCPEEAPEE